ncbi:hypothetical protein AWB69_01807 [Caballeronia udeis]|uniref:Uncharacterized protein n=1 Tax=Caballeronia udeis TaxID=1232866 RepID=A0A158FXQ1_9BURK|nr:hypothetical protein AWB69_01807 [Caballeronia udeis]
MAASGALISIDNQERQFGFSTAGSLDGGVA